ncbi:hypothetical protein AVEN_62028-1, partial [Araneus ventricosus]
MHPAKFLIDKQITTQPLKEYPTTNSTYTDGSKNDDGTESAFCCFDEENRISSTWMGKLSKENNVFQAELQAIKHHENASNR